MKTLSLTLSSTRWLILTLASLQLFPLSPWAQDSDNQDSDNDAAAAEVPQFYQVELIVFRNLDQSRTTGEIPRTTEPEMAEMLEQDLARLSVAKPRSSEGEPEAEPAKPAASEMSAATDSYFGDEPVDELVDNSPPLWIPVEDDGLLLADTAAAIDQLQAYELLSYLRWAQPAADVAVAEQLDIMDLGADPDVVVGTVELHQRRYLHLLIDVTLASNHGGAASSGYTRSFQFFDAPAALPALKDSRRMRLERLHYFDQPQFGVLAMISRFEVPEVLEVPEEAGQEELSAQPNEPRLLTNPVN
jgi:hypothetical protein